MSLIIQYNLQGIVVSFDPALYSHFYAIGFASGLFLAYPHNPHLLDFAIKPLQVPKLRFNMFSPDGY